MAIPDKCWTIAPYFSLVSTPAIAPASTWSGAIGGTVEALWAHAPATTVNRTRKHTKTFRVRARTLAASSHPSSYRRHGAPSDRRKSSVRSNGKATYPA